MAIQKVSGVDKGSLQAVSGVAKTSIQAISGATASFEQHASIGAFTSVGESSYRPVIAYDTAEDKVVCCYQAVDDNHLMAVVGTVAASGAISFGTPVTVDEGGTSTGGKPLSIAYNVRDADMYFHYNIYDTSGNNNYKTYLKRGSVSGTSISFASADLMGGGAHQNANSTYTTVRNYSGSGDAGEVVHVRIRDDDTSSEKMDFIAFSDDSDAALYDNVDPQPSPTTMYTNDQTPDPQDVGITWGNLHGGTNAVDRVFIAGRNSPSGTVTGQIGAYSMSASSNVVAFSEGGWTDIPGYGAESDTENYHVAWDEKLGKGVIVAQVSEGSHDNAGYFWTFSVNTTTNNVTVNSGTNEHGYLTSNSDTQKSINVIYNYDAGHFVVMYHTEYDFRGVSITLNSSDNTASVGSEFTAYNGTGSSNEANVQPTSLSPDRIDLAYIPDGSPGVLYAAHRQVSGTTTCHVGRLSAFGTTNYSQAAG